ncbi:hypothetical protein LP419_20065 [Massilia sp. H-1]|nr:hypothetical protein LP419_20065 [Massilia sp. H-1]
MKEVDVVINAVGIFRESGAQTFARLHTDTPCALFAACAASDSVRLVIQISALGADQDADTAYHLSKKAADDFLATLPPLRRDRAAVAGVRQGWRQRPPVPGAGQHAVHRALRQSSPGRATRACG